MKRQTLILLSITALLLVIALVVGFFAQREANLSSDSSRMRAETFGAVSVRIPEGFQPSRTRRHQAWDVREFNARLGHLQLAAEPAGTDTFQEACAHWFSMPTYVAGPTIYEASGRTWFFKAVPVFGDGAYVMHKRGKTLHFVCVFTQGGLRHWIELVSNSSFTSTKDVFDRMLLSMRTPEGKGPNPALEASLRPILRESRFRFVWPLWFLPLFPLLPMMILFGILGLIGRRAGRLPNEGTLVHQAHFLEGHLEIGLSSALQRQFMNAAVVVTPEDVMILTFGTPFIVLPRSDCAARMTTGVGWFGAEYMELTLDDAAGFRKHRWKYGQFRGALRLRIYIKEVVRLRAAIG